MNNQFTNTSPHNNYVYTQQPNSAHRQSIPLDTILKGVNGIATNNYPKIPTTIPPTTRVVEKQPPIIQQQHTPIKRFDQTVQLDGQRQKIIQRQHNNITSRQDLNAPLPPQRRVQYIPYQQRYVEYVEQRVRVPVQKVMTDYYQVEHIIDYVPIQKADIVYVTQPQQVVDMKLQYVPVQQRIIHIKQQDAKMYGINQQHVNQYHLQQNKAPPAYQPPQVNNPVNHTFNPNYQPLPVNYTFNPNYVEMKNQILSKSRTNYVTAQGYDPNQKLQEIDQVLAASAVRQSRIKKNRQQSNAGQQILTNIVGAVTDMKKRQSIYHAIGGGFTEVGKKEGYSIKGSGVK